MKIKDVQNDESLHTAHRRLSDEELEHVVEQVRTAIYADVGQNVVKHLLYLLGAVGSALLAWLAGSGHIKLGG